MFKKRILFIPLIVFLIVIFLLIILRNQIVVALYYAQRKPPDVVEKIPLPDLDPQLQQELTAYLRQHLLKPQDYIINKLQDHDIVFLGEMHRARHDPELVQRLIPMLYRNGVYNLGMEFACHKDQPLIDSLLNAPTYDPSVTNRILFNALVTWSYQEYADIFKAAWRLNRTLPDSAPKFRIVGLHPFVDWSYAKSRDDLKNPQIMAKVFPEGRNGDLVMAQNVLREFVAKNQKALIYCGLHHAFTRYYQPIYNERKKQFDSFIKNRMGNIVYRAIGERAFTVSLHQPWISAQGWSAPMVYPADGVIDALMNKLGPDYYPVGFDTRDTPFGKLTGKTSLYHYGYENFTLADFCDGYIFQKPLSQYQSVRHIHGFISKENVELARERLPNLALKNSIWWKILSPAAIDTMMYSEADIENRLIRFQ